MSNVLDPIDQMAFDVERAMGTTNLLQCAWIYSRAVDIAGLKHFHANLGRNPLAARQVERSALPFGRHRWVAASRTSEVEVVAEPRPRHEFAAWLDEQPGSSVDAEHGPGWHLAVLPFSEGGAGVSLVISHVLTDGIGLSQALVGGGEINAHWPPAASRKRVRALREDIKQTVRDVGEFRRAGAAAIRLGRQQGKATASPPAPQVNSEELVVIPRSTVFVDARDWDTRAQALGGTANTLVAAFAAQLAQSLGRVTAEGHVTLDMPVNERVPGDTRGGAIRDAHMVLDPALAATDLRQIRASIKAALTRHRDLAVDDEMALLPLIPLLPRRVLKRMVHTVRGNTTRVLSSNLGDMPIGSNCPDGTDAAYFAMMWKFPHATKSLLHRGGGLLALLSGRQHGHVFLSAFAYQPDHANDELSQRLLNTLEEFSLTGTVL